VVNRSEGAGSKEKLSFPKKVGSYLDIVQSHTDEIGSNELNINLKISYKTILLVLVAFNVTGRVIERLT
jgi:hypothetical protein